MKHLTAAVGKVYEIVTAATPRVEGNPCGSCRSCCTAEAKSHKVSELELITMEEHLGKDRVAPFRRYLARERGVDGDFLMPTCPMLGPRGCTVHEVRPMACRLYGHFRGESSPLFAHCVFRGQETVFADHQEHLLTPGQPELTELNLEYLSYFPPGYGAQPVRETPRYAAQTPLERASELKCQGGFAAARKLLQELCSSGETPNLLLMLAECHEALGEYLQAVDVLQRAIALRADNPELHTRLGANYLWMGELYASAEALRRSIALASDRRNAQGLMGVVCQLRGDLTTARLHLTRAVELEDEPGPYRFSLANVLLALGEDELSRHMFRRALEYPPTRDQAEQALSR